MAKRISLYVSVDAEGMPYVGSLRMWGPGDPYYRYTEKSMTLITSIVISQAVSTVAGEADMIRNIGSAMRSVKACSEHNQRVYLPTFVSGIPEAIKDYPWLAERISEDEPLLTVTVADSHGSMMNIDPYKLWEHVTDMVSEWLCHAIKEQASPGDPFMGICKPCASSIVGGLVGVSVIRGFPRPLSMVVGAEGHDAAFFLGYHATQQMGGVLGHIIGGSIVQRIRVEGESDASEYLLNTLLLGEKDVPVALVAGDERLRAQVEKHTPWAVFIPLTETVSGLSSKTPPFPLLVRRLREGVESAIKKITNRGLKPLKPKAGWIEVEFKRPWFADVAELIPCSQRLDGLRVRFDCGGYEKSFRAVEAAVIMAYSVKR